MAKTEKDVPLLSQHFIDWLARKYPIDVPTNLDADLEGFRRACIERRQNRRILDDFRTLFKKQTGG